jgi:glyoxylase-like metal-dependent hydrolase (beta-lactamase superfamily II)
MSKINRGVPRASLRKGLKTGIAVLAVALGSVGASAGASQERTPYGIINAAAAASPITVTPIRGNVSLLEGSGGNVGILTGPEGFFMVDTGIAVSRDKIREALKTLGPGPLRYAVNTHWHWDHADGNAWVREAGATVIASSNTEARLGQTIRVAEWQHTFTPNRLQDRPNLLLRGPKTIKLNGEAILIRPYVPGHTDGDVSVYFPKADVLQVGDTWWNGQYPFIDYVAGGSIDGAIRLANANIAMAKPSTIVIPGHGPVGTRAQLIAFRDMLVTRRQMGSVAHQRRPLHKARLPWRVTLRTAPGA